MRADSFLFTHGFASSRTEAGRIIDEGKVLKNGAVIKKRSDNIEEGDCIRVEKNDLQKYVSRGALKLVGALDAFAIKTDGFVAVDIGASTGGFTEVLLERGAKLVYAVDVGVGQLHERLRGDKRIVSLEKVNARFLDKTVIPQSADIVVMDVSFISQVSIYDSVARILKDGGIFISLIKPQFELDRKALSKKGIVKDKNNYPKVIERLKDEAQKRCLIMQGCVHSPILGGSGNTEFLAFFVKSGEIHEEYSHNPQ